MASSFTANDFLDALRRLVREGGHALPLMFQGIAELLPDICQFPHLARARLVFHEQEYFSPGWCASSSRTLAAIEVNGVAAGQLELVYLEQDESTPRFTPQEAQIVEFAATLLGKTVERLEAVEQLQVTARALELERSALQQSHAALTAVLDHIQTERQATGRAVAANVDKLVMPLVEALEARLPVHDRPVVARLRQSLEEIASPFADQLARAFAALTPLEIALCRMVRDELSSKEIAKLRGVSLATVARQREVIRRKLGILGTDTNLASYLRDAAVGRTTEVVLAESSRAKPPASRGLSSP